LPGLSLLASIRPPCSSTIFRTMVNPSPNPARRAVQGALILREDFEEMGQ
jgi:hypothetical protein